MTDDCRQALAAGCSLSTFMANNEREVLEPGPDTSIHHLTAFSPKATEIFHCEPGAGAGAGAGKLPGLKRKLGGGGDTELGRAKVSCAGAGAGAGSLISPPLFKPRPNLAMVPGYPHEAAQPAAATPAAGEHSGQGHQEDEWKNIKVVSI